MKRTITKFSGILPRYEKGNMPLGNAVKAENTDFFDGKLKGVLSSSNAQVILGSGSSLHKYNNKFIHDDGWHLNLTRNKLDLHIFSDDAGILHLQIIDDIDNLGIAVPDDIVSIVENATPGDLSGDYNYVITVTRELNSGNYVDESAPSNIYNFTTTGPTKTVTITMPANPGGFIEYWNIYRTIDTGSGGVTFYLVAQIPSTQATYDDGLSDSDLLLKDIIPSYYTNYDLSQLGISIFWNPPLESVDGITGDLKGSLFAWKDDVWYTNEPGQPQAWPIQYSQSVGSKIMAIICADSYASVLTESGIIHRIDYDKPILMRAEKTRGQNPCINSRAWTTTPKGLMYLSDSGVALFNGSESQIAFYYGFDENYYDKKVTNRTSCHMNYQDEKIFLFHPNTSGETIVYDIRNSEKPFFYTVTEDQPILASYRDIPTGSIYVFLQEDGIGYTITFLENLYTYRKEWVWKSGLIVDPRKNYLYPKKVTVKGSGVDVTLKIYLDDVLIATKLLSWETIYKRTLRFPSNSKGNNIQFEVSTETFWQESKGPIDFVDEVEVEYF